VTRRHQDHQAVDLAALNALQVGGDVAVEWRGTVAGEPVFGEADQPTALFLEFLNAGRITLGGLFLRQLDNLGMPSGNRWKLTPLQHIAMAFGGSETIIWLALGHDRPLFAFAGLWASWRGVRGPKSAPVEGRHELFGFLTTEANAIVAPIHPKAMPVHSDDGRRSRPMARSRYRPGAGIAAAPCRRRLADRGERREGRQSPELAL
jgi:hypothetical protein